MNEMRYVVRNKTDGRYLGFSDSWSMDWVTDLNYAHRLTEKEAREEAAEFHDCEIVSLENDDGVFQSTTLASAYSRLAMMGRGEAWPADEKDRLAVQEALRLILDRLNEVEQRVAILDQYANPDGYLR
jgi:hypothetical protein